MIFKVFIFTKNIDLESFLKLLREIMCFENHVGNVTYVLVHTGDLQLKTVIHQSKLPLKRRHFVLIGY